MTKSSLSAFDLFVLTCVTTENIQEKTTYTLTTGNFEQVWLKGRAKTVSWSTGKEDCRALLLTSMQTTASQSFGKGRENLIQ